MARNYGPAQDGLLAMISVLSVMFLVLFVSCAYFLTLRPQILAQEAAALAELARLDANAPAVAGYETEMMDGYYDQRFVRDYEPQYVELENYER